MAEEEKPSEDLVEKAKADRQSAKGPAGRVTLFVRQVINELGKVTRPTNKELINYTWVVLGFVAVMMVIISILDWAFFSVVGFIFTP
jgi:preprotein translocase subunit SecE